MSDYIKNLNEAQRAAVVHFEKPSLIVAGAGSGKTRVLTCRIAYMLEQGVAPHTILALTFTNKAAAEMRERIAALVGQARSRYIWMGTFHSIFSRILRAEAASLGYPQSFTIYDTADSRNVIKTIVRELSLSDETYKPAVIQARISLAKNNLVTPEAYEANAALVGEDRERKVPQLCEIYKRYAARCREYGAMDFDDLLLNINILFRDFPQVLAKYQQMFRYILVDEYQDTNYAQYIIIRRLAQHHSNVCVVGDDAQSIYSFRGAKIENILRFRNDFPGAEIFKLEQNYRSTQTIVNAANSVIGKNRNQIRKESFSEGAKGEAIKVLKAYTDQEEASLVADELRARVRDSGADWSEAALLYRTNMQSRVMEEALRRRGIPYKIYGGLSFYQRKEVKDLIAYIRLVVNPKDDEAFRRIVNYPARGIGDVTLNRIGEAAAAHGVSLWEAVSMLPADDLALKSGAGKKVGEFVELIRSLSLMRATTGLYDMGLEIAARSGIIGLYKMENTPEAMSALDNIQELLNSMKTFEEQREEELRMQESSPEEAEGLPEGAGVQVSGPPTLEEWLQNVALLTDADNEKPDERNKVTLMTVHSAKGLEFRFVFIVGLEENLFPNLMGMGTLEGLEEERRLFYVALTRAKEAAVLTFSETRFKWGNTEFCRPSRFLSEIDPKYLDIAFDLEGPGEGGEEHPVEGARRRFAERESGGAPAGRYGASREGYGGGAARGGYAGRDGRSSADREYNTQRGEAARRWVSPRPGGGSPAAPRPVERVEVPRPQVGEGTRFRSMGVRAASPAVEGDVPPSRFSAPSSGTAAYAEGMTVEHGKFGRGRIVAVERASDDVKLVVEFDGAGRKTLLSKFARLTVIG